MNVGRALFKKEANFLFGHLRRAAPCVRDFDFDCDSGGGAAVRSKDVHLSLAQLDKEVMSRHRKTRGEVLRELCALIFIYSYGQNSIFVEIICFWQNQQMNLISGLR